MVQLPRSGIGLAGIQHVGEKRAKMSDTIVKENEVVKVS